jgi:hypothetical protein
MRTRWILILLLSLLFVGQAFASDGTELQISAGMPGAIVTMEKVIDDGKVLISVSDAANNPVLGLTTGDFIITTEGKTAKIVSVQPIEHG